MIKVGMYNLNFSLEVNGMKIFQAKDVVSAFTLLCKLA
jgi:hypothetical protein